jgi:preprotein translocase subunit SecG
MIATLLYIVFVLSAIVLIVVILLQEGRGGGFGQALGEHGQQTFGVGAKGINTFTMYAAAVFVGSALMLHILNRGAGGGSVLDAAGSVTAAPADPTQPIAPVDPGGK